MDVHARNLLSTWVNIMMLGMSVWQQRRLENWGIPGFHQASLKNDMSRNWDYWDGSKLVLQ